VSEPTSSPLNVWGRFASASRDLGHGWDRFPVGTEAVVLYDKGDACFGYAVNLDWADAPEWGYAPFGG
jgi:hypothetical protein